MNGVPSLTLPSISEDDENAHEEEETSPLSPNRSPLHAVNSSPRHTKFNLRLDELREGTVRSGRGRSLVKVRERVERQRSVVVAPVTTGNSLEELNHELRGEVEHTRSSVERLDTQVSTLHQDVAVLSMEVCLNFLLSGRLG